MPLVTTHQDGNWQIVSLHNNRSQSPDADKVRRLQRDSIMRTKSSN